MKVVAFARLASYFFLLSQEKVTKKKATPYRLFPALLSLMGGNRELANKSTWLKQPLAENSYETEQRRRGSRGFKVKGVVVSRLVDVLEISFFRHSRESGNPFVFDVGF